MKLSTLDILDKDLGDQNDGYLNMSDEVRFRFFKEEFLLDRIYWERYYNNLKTVPFDWKEFKYRDVKKLDDIDRFINSDEIGVYLFVIKPDKMIYDLPKFVFYVGIAGEGGSGRPLKVRLKDYFNLSAIKKRLNVHRMLFMYHKDVYVAYSILKYTPDLDLEKIEEDLHGYFYPIINKRDFPVELKKLKKAF